MPKVPNNTILVTQLINKVGPWGGALRLACELLELGKLFICDVPLLTFLLE